MSRYWCLFCLYQTLQLPHLLHTLSEQLLLVDIFKLEIAEIIRSDLNQCPSFLVRINRTLVKKVVFIIFYVFIFELLSTERTSLKASGSRVPLVNNICDVILYPNWNRLDQRLDRTNIVKSVP